MLNQGFYFKIIFCPSKCPSTPLLHFRVKISQFLAAWSLKGRTLSFIRSSLRADAASGGRQEGVAGLFCNCNAQKTQFLLGLVLFAASLRETFMPCVTSDSPRGFSTVDYLWQCFPESLFLAKRPKVMSFLC